MPLLIQVTVRDTEAPSDASRTELLGQILGHRNTERVALERLTETEVSEYAAARLGTVDVEVGRAVFARSEGNPFFMAELLRPFGPSAPPRNEPITLSGPVLDVVRQRIRQLTGDARQNLSVAAVIGREFDIGLLAAVTGCDTAALLETLDVARATQVIREVADRPGDLRVRSRHPPERARGGAVAARADWNCTSASRRHSSAAIRPVTACRGQLSCTTFSQPCRWATRGLRSIARSGPRRRRRPSGLMPTRAAVLRRALAALDLLPDPDPRLRSLLLFGVARCARATGNGDFMGAFSEAVSIARAHGVAEVLVLAGTYMSPAPGSPTMHGAREVLEGRAEILASGP